MRIYDKKKFFIFLIIFIVFFGTIVISLIYKYTHRSKETNEDYSNNIVEAAPIHEEYDELPTEFSSFNDFYSAYLAKEAIDRIKSNAYSIEATLGTLDDIYLSHFNLDKTNIAGKIESYKKQTFKIVDVKVARYNYVWLYLLTTDDGKQFLYKYDDTYHIYTLFLDDYLAEIGLDEFCKEGLGEVLAEIPKGSPYNTENLEVSDISSIFNAYRIFYSDAETAYNNYLTQETRNKYSYDTFVSKFYNNEYSMFNMDFNPINYKTEVNEYGLYTANFKDTNGYDYTLVEKSYFDFEIDIK